jgi:flavodoxin
MSVKTLVAYYTWSGNTEEIAERIHHQLPGSDLFKFKLPLMSFQKICIKLAISPAINW